MFDDILVTIMVFGSIILLLQVMILISYWRRGTKYAAMEKIYRQRQAEANAKEARLKDHPLADWDFYYEEEDYESLEDPITQHIKTTLDNPPQA